MACAPPGKNLYVLLGGGIRVHVGFHGRGDDQWASGNQHRIGEQVIGDPVRQLGDGIGRGRRDQHQVCRLPEADMQHVSFPSPEVLIGIGFASGYGLE